MDLWLPLERAGGANAWRVFLPPRSCRREALRHRGMEVRASPGVGFEEPALVAAEGLNLDRLAALQPQAGPEGSLRCALHPHADETMYVVEAIDDEPLLHPAAALG